LSLQAARVRFKRRGQTVVVNTFKMKVGSDTNTGKPIVSYDDGKTWQWFAGDKVPDPEPDKVFVGWSKAPN
jgi:hypothetical protein